MEMTGVKRRALAGAGAVARRLPSERAQLFAFAASPAARADPWRLYQRLHRNDPVRPTPIAAWIVASHAGVTDVLRHPETSVHASRADRAPPTTAPGPLWELMQRTLLFTDPPGHGRLRRLVSRAFTPRTVEALRPRIEEKVDDTLARLRPRGSADLLAELALPLPAAVICDLLGIPSSERSQFLAWGRDFVPGVDVDLYVDRETRRRSDGAAVELDGFLHELIADPGRRDPGGLLAALLAVDDEGDRLTPDEITTMGVVLLVAGFETTANLVANGLLTLLRTPDQLALLRDGEVDPAVAVEELVRHDGPIQLVQRVLLTGLEIGGHRIPERTLVALLIGAANRDPRVFADPDRLDLRRAPNPHVAFSSGIHFCLGAALARLEAAVVLTAVLRTLPDLRLAGRPRWRPTFVVRGLQTLPVAWRT